MRFSILSLVVVPLLASCTTTTETPSETGDASQEEDTPAPVPGTAAPSSAQASSQGASQTEETPLVKGAIEASGDVAAELRDDGLLAHTGPRSPFDKPSNTGQVVTPPEGLEASLASQWSCLSRPEVTVCRGINGAGRGHALWIRYRGRLLEKTSAEVPLFVRVGVGTRAASFPLRTDAFGASLFLTDGLLQCARPASAKKSAKTSPKAVAVGCQEAPLAMKTLFRSFPTTKGQNWTLDLRFGVTLQPSPQQPAEMLIDAGTPSYLFELPARVEKPASPALPQAEIEVE